MQVWLAYAQSYLKDVYVFFSYSQSRRRWGSQCDRRFDDDADQDKIRTSFCQYPASVWDPASNRRGGVAFFWRPIAPYYRHVCVYDVLSCAVADLHSCFYHTAGNGSVSKEDSVDVFTCRFGGRSVSRVLHHHRCGHSAGHSSESPLLLHKFLPDPHHNVLSHGYLRELFLLKS